MWVNPRGNFKASLFRAECNGPNGLSLDLIHIQGLESYSYTGASSRAVLGRVPKTSVL